jgi:hypothetical protein
VVSGKFSDCSGLPCSTTDAGRGVPAEHNGDDLSGPATSTCVILMPACAWNRSFNNCVCDRIGNVA